MTEWTTIRVKQDAKDAAEEQKPDGMTWSEYLTDADRPNEIDETKVADRIIDDVLATLPAEVADEMKTRLR